MAKLNATQKAKRDFRKSKKWIEFRKKVYDEYGGLDPITLSKLRVGCSIHHRHVTADMQEYKDISNIDDFCPFNSLTHKCLHWLWTYYKKDPAILQRIKDELDRWY
jgi:hypothetical protein